MVQGIVQFLVKMNSKNAVNNTRTLKKEIDTAGSSSEELEAKLSAVDAIKLSAINTAVSTLTSTMMEAVKSASNYSYEFARVNMLTGATAEESKTLERQMLSLGSQTTLTTEQVAEAAQELGALGFSADDTSKALGSVVKAAEGTGASSQEVAVAMASIEKQFGLTADSSEHMADVLTISANESAADVSYMGDAFKYVGKDAANLGMSVEETAAVIMVLADNGLAASQAGTGLRAVLKNLTAPTEEAQAALDDLGVSVYNSDGSFRGFSTVIGDLQTAFSGLSEEERNNAARAIAGKTASAAFLTIVDGGPDKINAYTKALQDSTGAADEASAALRDTLTAQFNSLFGSITNVVYALLSLLEPALILLIKSLVLVLGAIQFVILGFRDWISQFPIISKLLSVFVAGLIVYAIVTSIATAETIAKTVATLAETAAMVALTVVEYAAIFAIAVLIAAVAYVIIKFIGWENITNAVTTVLTALRDFIQKYIIPILKSLASFITGTIIPAWKSFYSAVGELVISILQSLWAIINGSIIPILQMLNQLIIGPTIAAFTAIWNILSPLIIPVFQLLYSVISTVNNLIKTGLIIVLKTLDAILKALVEPLTNFASLLSDKLASAIEFVRPGLEFLQTIFTSISNIVGKVASGISGLADSIMGIFPFSAGTSFEVQRTGAAFNDTQTVAYRNMAGFGQMHGNALQGVTNNDSTSYNDSRQYQIVVNSVEEANKVVDAHKEWKEMIKG